MPRKLDIDAEFSILYHADAGDVFEVRLRRLMVLILGVLVAIAGSSIWFVIWAAVFCLIDFVYVRFLKDTPRPVQLPRFRKCVLLTLCLATWAGIFPILLMVIFGEQFVFVAACFVVGFALHSITRNTAFSVSTTIGLTTVFVGATGITFFELYMAKDLWTQITIFFAGVAVQMFFLFSFNQIVRDRVRFAAGLENEAQSEKMKSLGQLTSGIAHDFNNLLTVIGGNIELAQTEKSANARDEFLGEALDASRKAGSLVSHLLAFSRKSKLRAEDLPLNSVIKDLEIGLLRVLPANVELEASPAFDKVNVLADRVMLESAVLNLVINARDAIGKEPGKVWLSVKTAKSSGFAELRVEDTGPGMSLQQMAKAVEPFFTTKGIGEGSGLGLSMVNGFAEQSGGRLDLGPRAGGGLRVSLFLPLAAPEK